MKFTSLDNITRSILLQKKLSVHFYLEYLKYANDIYREFHFDTLKVVNAKVLPINSYNAFTLPCDFVDLVKVAIPIGQFVRPLTQRDGINRLHNFDDTTGNIVPYNGIPPIDQIPVWITNWLLNDYNEHGEPIGRRFGQMTAGQNDTYKLLKERNEIQLHESIVADEIILEYISDGTYTDAATKVDTMAQAAIEAYAKWQGSMNADNKRSPEADRFFGEWRKLRARMGNYTIADIKRIIQRNYHATYKN